MAQERIAVQMGELPATLLGPLYLRAKLTDRPDPILDDPKAKEIVSKLDYDFEHMIKGMPYCIQGGLVMRARLLDEKIRDFVKRFPEATIVNLGAGLDTAFQRTDNGRIHWVDIDLPESVELRRKFLPESERSRIITGSMFDDGWFREIPKDKGVFFQTAGTVMYFTETELRPFFDRLARNFPGAEFAFDMLSPAHIQVYNAVMRKRNLPLAQMKQGMTDIRRMEKWSPHLQTLEFDTIHHALLKRRRLALYQRVILWGLHHARAWNMVHFRFI